MSRQQKLAIQRGSAVAFILTIAALLFAFGFIAQEVATGKTSAFDRQITTLVVAGYLFLAGKSAVAWLVLIAVLGGIALSDLLKFAFGRARPDVVPPLARVFTTSFPSGHAALSAITYLAIGAVLARTQPSHAISLYFLSLAVFMTVLIGISRIPSHPSFGQSAECFGRCQAGVSPHRIFDPGALVVRQAGQHCAIVIGQN
jgi:membrane-associated phospholipid phosphatase